MRLNISTNYLNHTQNNNEIRPLSTCGPTSGGMFLLYSKEDFFIPKGMQLEDFISATALSKEGYDFFLKFDPLYYPEYAPYEVHSCLSWAINRVAGKKVTEFRDNWTIKEVLFSIAHGKPVIISGYLADLHHVVCLVGLDTEQEDIKNIDHPDKIDLTKVKSIIFDDPYGDPRGGVYNRKVSGDDIEVPYSYFLNHFKPLRTYRKWAHMHMSIVQKLNEAYK